MPDIVQLIEARHRRRTGGIRTFVQPGSPKRISLALPKNVAEDLQHHWVLAGFRPKLPGFENLSGRIWCWLWSLNYCQAPQSY
jgi:hypothetical protein